MSSSDREGAQRPRYCDGSWLRNTVFLTGYQQPDRTIDRALEEIHADRDRQFAVCEARCLRSSARYYS
jgi:hypothetical protein